MIKHDFSTELSLLQSWFFDGILFYFYIFKYEKELAVNFPIYIKLQLTLINLVIYTSNS